MRRFLLAVDRPEDALRAVDYLLPFIQAFPGSRVYLLTLLSGCPYTDLELQQLLEKSPVETEVHGAEDHLSQISTVRRQHRRLGERFAVGGAFGDSVFSEIHPVELGVAEDIWAHAERLGCDTAVVARGESSGFHHLLLGSVSATLVRETRNLAVWVVC